VKEEPVAIHVNHGPESASLSQKKEVTVAIHQPNYIPWLGYFYKISRVHKFVFLDMVPAPDKGGFVNRNSIRTQTGAAWLTIPVLRSGRFGQPISQIKTDNSSDWARRHLTTLRTNYRKAPYFRDVFDLLQPIYEHVSGEHSLLAEFNIVLIRTIAYFLGLEPEWLRASALPASGHKTDLVASVCLSTGATVYLAGSGARSYQDDQTLISAGITPTYSCFTQKSYPQRFGEFIANLSIVDVLMNCGYDGTRQLLNL
jgi:hypothetical protein